MSKLRGREFWERGTNADFLMVTPLRRKVRIESGFWHYHDMNPCVARALAAYLNKCADQVEAEK